MNKNHSFYKPIVVLLIFKRLPIVSRKTIFCISTSFISHTNSHKLSRIIGNYCIFAPAMVRAERGSLQSSLEKIVSFF